MRGEEIAYTGALDPQSDTPPVRFRPLSRNAAPAGNEIAILIGRQQRHVEHILVIELDAEYGRGLRLDLGPVGESTSGAFQHLAGRDRIAGRVEHVLAQEHLVRRMRGVGLILIHESRGRVRVFVDVVRGAQSTIRVDLIPGPREDHEVGLVPAVGDIVGPIARQWIIRPQGDEHGAAAALLGRKAMSMSPLS